MDEERYQKRTQEIIDEMTDNIRSESLTNYSKTRFKEEELAKVLDIRRQTLNKARNEDHFGKYPILVKLLETFDNNSDVIKFLLMKYELEQILEKAIEINNESYRTSCLEAISYLTHWETSSKYQLEQKMNIYEYISNYYVKKNPLHYFFYDLFKRDKRILLTLSIEPNGNEVDDIYMMFINDPIKTLELQEYLKSLNLNFPISFENYLDTLIKVSNHFKKSYIHYPDSFNENEYIINKVNNKKILEKMKKIDFFDLRRLVKTSMDDKCFLNDVLDYFGIDSKYVYNSTKIKALKIEELINLITLHNLHKSSDNERLLYHCGSDDFKITKPYQSSIMINRNRHLNIKRINLHMHSTYSDGVFSVNELYNKMKTNNLDIISLTDHDTIEGIDEMKELCEKDKTIKFIPGCEFSVVFDEIKQNSLFSSDFTLHILAYNFNISKMKQKLNEFKNEKENDYIKYINELNKKFKINIPKDIDNNFQKTSIVKYLVKEGIFDSNDKAYEELSNLGWKSKKMTMDRLRTIINETGGVLVWAHPYDVLYGSSKIKINNTDIINFLEVLKSYKIDGIEAMYSSFNLDEQKFLTKIANENNLFISYGTDYHKDKPNQKLYLEVNAKEINEKLVKEVK